MEQTIVEESIAAAPSEDNGNVPVDAPSEPPKEEVAAPKEEPAKVEEPVTPELYDLGDRKVDAETLYKEYKENLLPEFTRRSQELAQLKQGKDKAEEPKNPYADPNYVPQSYEEIVSAAEQRALQAIENRQKAEVERRQALENEVGNQLSELKKADAALNENQLFLHANKYGFKDLKVAYQNMKDMNALAKNVQQTTAKNIQKRAAEPISTTPGQSTGVRPDPSQFSSAIDYLRSLK